MKTPGNPISENHRIALEPGYTEEQIRQFQDLSDLLDFWNDEVGAGRASVSDVPEINPELYSAWCKYHKKIMDRKVESYTAVFSRSV